MAEHEEHPNPEKLWRHRRWMGWYGVIGASVSAVVGLAATANVEPATADAMRPVVTTSIWGHLFLAAVYQGGASVVDAVARLRHGPEGGRH